MKKQDIERMSGKTYAELLKDLKEIRKELIKLRIDMSLKKVKNTNLVSEKKKNIARILTILSIKKEEQKDGK